MAHSSSHLEQSPAVSSTLAGALRDGAPQAERAAAAVAAGWFLARARAWPHSRPAAALVRGRPLLDDPRPLPHRLKGGVGGAVIRETAFRLK